VAGDPGQEDSEEAEASAELDAVLVHGLAEPESAEDLYDDTATKYRPIMMGDIFTEVLVPGSTDEEQASGLAMVVAHPSGMRTGPALVERARAAPVVRDARLNSAKVIKGHIDFFQLPLLTDSAARSGVAIGNGPWGARLDLAAPVSTSGLDLQRRIVCLSETGVELLVQRLSFSDTRVAVNVDLIREQLTPKLLEILWLHRWNERLVAPLVEGRDEGDLEEELERAAAEFDDFIKPLRELLDDPMGQVKAQRLVFAEIDRRQAELDQ
jgi:hypothetical protein